MNDNEINLLNRIQDEFPIQKRPFLEVANDLGMEEEEVITLIKELKENGYIRRLGGFFDTKSLGYVSTLCAMIVPENRIDEVASVINSYPGVTHNYIRKHEYNMWFTLTAQSVDTLESTLNEIQDKTGIDQIMNLPSTKTYKVKVHLCV
jgi:DNA-binding Lrp family transcriptional regulator